jgi:hypothetical protein
MTTPFDQTHFTANQGGGQRPTGNAVSTLQWIHADQETQVVMREGTAAAIYDAASMGGVNHS